MSILIQRLPLALGLSPIDLFPIDQGDPPVTRMATLAMIRAASTSSVGPVGPRIQIRGPVHFSELPLASIAYLNDTMMVDQGSPPITRTATIAQIMGATISVVSQNTEIKVPNVSQRISDLPISPP